MKLFHLLLLAVFFKSLFWAIFIPMWQTPDEQAHFAQTQFFFEQRSFHITQSSDLSQEVALSEDLLGTRRNERGNNSYTYNSGFKPDYVKGDIGKYESVIRNQAKSSRTTYVGQEAAHYPPLYYILSLPFYGVVENGSLFDTVFVVRLLSVLLSVLYAVVTFKIGKLMWQSDLMGVCLAAFVSFQPMLSYVFAGVHPDNLLNLLYAIGLLLLLHILKSGLNFKYLFGLGVVSLFGLATKHLMFPFLPLAVAVLVWVSFKHRLAFKAIVATLILLAPVAVFALKLPLPFVPTGENIAPITFTDYLKFRLPKIFFELWPWTWGVFKWLGVVQAPLTLKVITRLGLLSALGLIVYVFKKIRAKSFDFQWRAFSLFAISTISYAVYLFLWDFRLMVQMGFSQGLQGRYFFPNLIPILTLMLLGFMAFVPQKFARFKVFVAVLATFLMFVLNLLSLNLLKTVYFSAPSLQVLVDQISQYKPYFLKGSVQPIIFLLFLLFSVVFFLILAKSAIITSSAKKTSN